MQIKKIVPLALAAVMTAAASAGAADVQVAKIDIPNSITSQARQKNTTYYSIYLFQPHKYRKKMSQTNSLNSYYND